MSGRPRVVACVPAWNAEDFIEQTLDALAAQTHDNLEILISDDASTDGTADVCERYAARDPRFRVIRQPQNLGWTGNVNALLRAADGDYFLFAFHDDVLKPAYIARLVEALESDPGAVLAYSDIETVLLDGRRVPGSYTELDGAENRTERARRVLLQRGDWWIPHRGIFRSYAATRIGGLRRHLGGEFSADWPWLAHLSMLGRFLRVPEQLCCKVYQKESLSLRWKRNPGKWLGVALSCVTEIRNSELSVREKLSLYALMALRCAIRLLLWPVWLLGRLFGAGGGTEVRGQHARRSRA